ncbi:MAG: peptidylprolyl isomerase [Dongiaceae bacterium]
MSQLARRFSWLVLVALTALAAGPATAQDTLRIVALVNDEAITAIDLAARTRMLVASGQMQNTPEIQQRLRPQVLRALIDERLRQQAADREGIVVSQDRIDERMAQLARSNNLSPENFRTALTQNGIDPAWIEQQIRTEVAWSLLVSRKFRPGIVVTDEDIDNAQRQMRENQGTTQYRVAEIFLSIDDPNDTPAVQEAAQRLLEQLKQGANFGAVARQFSQAASAGNGGLLGWVAPSDLAPELAAAVETMAPGTVTGPIRSDGGLHIVALVDRRAAQADALTREQISERLVRDRLDLMARGYLRDIRRSAYVDIRQ